MEIVMKKRNSLGISLKIVPLFSGAAFSERYLGLPAKEEHAYSVSGRFIVQN